MKLVDHNGLMLEPEGTIFQEFGKRGLGEPQVFGGPCGQCDYVTAKLFPNDNCFYTFGGTLDLAKLSVTEDDYGIWYPSGFGRDGMFDTSRYYLIWEEQDRKKFAEWLLDPVKAANEQNSDPIALIQVDWNIRVDCL